MLSIQLTIVELLTARPARPIGAATRPPKASTRTCYGRTFGCPQTQHRLCNFFRRSLVALRIAEVSLGRHCYAVSQYIKVGVKQFALDLYLGGVQGSLDNARPHVTRA